MPNPSPYAYERRNQWEISDEATRKNIFAFSEDYKAARNVQKTERDVVSAVAKQARTVGYQDISEVKFAPGTKILFQNEAKNLLLAHIGKRSLTEGVNIVVAHTDVLRLDLKVLPLVEEHKIAMLKTHYYGGMKKYQWVNQVMGLYGTVMRKDGSEMKIAIGDDPKDPVFTVPDVLPHLAQRVQGEEKLLQGIKGENLNLLAGSIPIEDKETEKRVKAQVLQLLHDKYGLVEEDFISAELGAYLIQPHRDVGLDRSMIGGAAHDDRACCFCASEALLRLSEVPEKTAITYLVDKEEIGSIGTNSAVSPVLRHALEALLTLEKGRLDALEYQQMVRQSAALSADVSVVVNPMFSEVHDLNTAANLNYGVILEKYTGARGKYSGNDASAEMMSRIRQTFHKFDVVWQIGGLGKVDEGGGGTVAGFIAATGIQVVDCGLGVMSMHAPFEIISKADLYSTWKAYEAFFMDA